MFNNQIHFNQDISKWNVSRLTQANQMFKNSDSFAQDIRSWDMPLDCSLNDLFLGADAMKNRFENYDFWPSDNETPEISWFKPQINKIKLIDFPPELLPPGKNFLILS